MDCAIMSGGDVGPMGKDAVTELHSLFRWASKSPRWVDGERREFLRGPALRGGVDWAIAAGWP